MHVGSVIGTHLVYSRSALAGSSPPLDIMKIEPLPTSTIAAPIAAAAPRSDENHGHQDRHDLLRGHGPTQTGISEHQQSRLSSKIMPSGACRKCRSAQFRDVPDRAVGDSPA
jgi:hypothetical protein